MKTKEIKFFDYDYTYRGSQAIMYFQYSSNKVLDDSKYPVIYTSESIKRYIDSHESFPGDKETLRMDRSVKLEGKKIDFVGQSKKIDISKKKLAVLDVWYINQGEYIELTDDEIDEINSFISTRHVKKDTKMKYSERLVQSATIFNLCEEISETVQNYQTQYPLLFKLNDEAENRKKIYTYGISSRMCSELEDDIIGEFEGTFITKDAYEILDNYYNNNNVIDKNDVMSMMTSLSNSDEYSDSIINMYSGIMNTCNWIKSANMLRLFEAFLSLLCRDKQFNFNVEREYLYSRAFKDLWNDDITPALKNKAILLAKSKEFDESIKNCTYYDEK